MGFSVVHRSEASEYNSVDGADVVDGVAAIQRELPPELLLPEREKVLETLPSLSQVKGTQLQYAATVSEVMAKLQEILDEVKAYEEGQEGPHQTPVQERIPQYANQFEIRCGLAEISPIIEVSYYPGRSWIPFIQSSKPATLSAVMKSFDGKRDIRFADLFLGEPGKKDFTPPESEHLLHRIADWLEGISNVVEEESKLRAKRQGYDDGNEHFEEQLLGGAVQLLALPRLEMVYGLIGEEEEEDEESISTFLSKKTNAAYLKVEGLLQQAEHALEDLCAKIGSADVEISHREYRSYLQEEFDKVLARLEPMAIKKHEARLKELNDEIAKKTEALANLSAKKVDQIAAKAALFEFLDKAVLSHNHDGQGNVIGVKHKMEWADTLSKVVKNSKRGLEATDLTRVLSGILSAAWMYKTESVSQTLYVHRKDINVAVHTVSSIFPSIDQSNLPSVIGVLDEMKKSKIEVSVDDISRALQNLCGVNKT